MLRDKSTPTAIHVPTAHEAIAESGALPRSIHERFGQTDVLRTMPPSAPVRPLRGRVVVRPVVPTRVGSIILTGLHGDWARQSDRSRGIKAQSSHEGVVLAMGPPALTHLGVEIAHGFGVGDRVRFVWTHNEEEYTRTWTDGEPCAWIAQAEVIGVYE